MSSEYELIMAARRNGTARMSSDVAKVIEQHCGPERVEEIDAMLEVGPITLKRSETRADLEVISRELRKVGAQAMIIEQVRPARPSSDKSESRTFQSFFQSYADKLHAIMHSIDLAQVEALVSAMTEARSRNQQIFVCGNGGSAALASHLVTDMAKERFVEHEALFRVHSLNDNMAWLSATANDFGYEKVFVNQLKNLLQPRDLVIAISSSGNSANIIEAVKFAKLRGATTWGIVGFDGGKLVNEADSAIYIPTKKGQYGYMEDVVSILSHIVSIYLYEQDCAVFTALE